MKKINLLPKTILGKMSVGLMALFFLTLCFFFLLIYLGQRGGQGFFDNLYLTIPGLVMAASGTLAFFTGIVSVVKNKERSVLVFLSTVFGFLIFLWCFTEVAFPH